MNATTTSSAVRRVSHDLNHDNFLAVNSGEDHGKSDEDANKEKSNHDDDDDCFSKKDLPTNDNHAEIHVDNLNDVVVNSELLSTSVPSSVRRGDCVQVDRSISECSSSVLDLEESRLRRKLAFFFLDPIRKFEVRRQVPWKLLLQFIKIVLVTTQLLEFGSYRYAHTKFYKDGQIALEHIFLRKWDATREVFVYPPTSGPLAIYTKSSFHAYIDHAAKAYYDLEQSALTPTFRSGDFDLCIQSFVKEPEVAKVFPNLTWTSAYVERQSSIKCLTIPLKDLKDLNSQSYLDNHDMSVPWQTLEHVSVRFKLKTLSSANLGPLLGPECFSFDVAINMENGDYDGQMPIRLTLEPQRIGCPHPQKLSSYLSLSIKLLNFVVILVCLLSLTLCMRALIRAQRLRVEAQSFFETRFNWTLTEHEKLEFLNVWYILICLNDLLIICGSVLKEEIENRDTFGDQWDVCSMLLGTGNLLVWVGMLRYLGFFKSYNLLIVTLKGALPSVLRFLLCALLIYMGFVFCGWLILGPYHPKFATILSTSECLFSLVNGDDMFATFYSVSSKHRMIWIFSRFYLYLFISLFIYVILSLCIAILMDTYEMIKEYHRNGWPKERLHDFYKDAKQRGSVFQANPDFLSRIILGLFRGNANTFNRERRTTDASEDQRPLVET